MDDSSLEVTRKHGEAMRRLAFEHALEMARLYRDYGKQPIDQLISHLEMKMASEELEHNRFDETHRTFCNDCRDAYEDFMHEQLIDDKE